MSYTQLSNRVVTTRNEHKCWGCGRTYPKGSFLNSISWLWEGEFMHGYFCKVCLKAIPVIMNNYDLESYSEWESQDYEEWHTIKEEVEVSDEQSKH